MQADEVDSLWFRNRRERERSHVENGGTPFWRIVWAVFTALCLFGLLQALMLAIVYHQAMKEVDRLTRQWQREVAQFQVDAGQEIAISTQSVQHRPLQPDNLPPYFGAIEARRRGETVACINGYISNRLPDGWSQTRQRCKATSQ